MPLPKITKCNEIFNSEQMDELEDYTVRYLKTLITQLKDLRTSRATNMRRILEGRPQEEQKSFPWDNAANLVIQLVASFTDQLAARMVMGIHNTLPLFPIKIMGTVPAELKPERKRELLEDFLTALAMDPSTINLIETEYTWFRNAIAYGCQALKVNFVDDSSWQVKDGKVKEVDGYVGPRLMPIEYEDFLMPVEPMPVNQMPFKAQAIHLSRWDIEERIASKSWDKEAGETILASAAQSQEDQPRKDAASDQKINPSPSEEAQVFTIYECHVKFRLNERVYECIVTVHPETEACPKSIFRFYPADIPEFILIRFGGHGKRAYGLGLIEALQDYQTEVSSIHNQRRDAGTAANTNVLRVTPGSQLDTMTTLYPMGLIPAPPGAIEVLPLGRNPIETIQDENLVRQEAAERAGVHPSASGSGSGGPNKKGVYSAMGTMSTMQEGNSRTDMNLALFRGPHVLLGQTLLGLSAHFGVDKRILKGYGEDRKIIEEALEGYVQGTLRAHVHPGTASVNREVEKQNLMLMAQNMRQWIQESMQMVTMIDNPMTPPDVKMFLSEALVGMNTIYRWILRNFGIHDGGQDLMPNTDEILKKAKEQQEAQNPQKQLAPPQPQPGQPQGQQQPQPNQPPIPPGGPVQ